MGRSINRQRLVVVRRTLRGLERARHPGLSLPTTFCSFSPLQSLPLYKVLKAASRFRKTLPLNVTVRYISINIL